MKQGTWRWVGLAFWFALPLLAGCGQQGADPLSLLAGAEEDLRAQAMALADEAEGAFSDLLPAALSPQAEAPRTLTLVQEGEELVAFSSLRGWTAPNTLADVPGKPLSIVWKCTSPPRVRCHGFVGTPEGDGSGQYRMRWYGARGNGGRQSEATALEVEFAPGTPPPNAKPIWSYNKLGIGGFWADSRLWALSGLEVHLRYGLPGDLPGEELASGPAVFDSLARFTDRLRQACCGLPKPFEVEWPPAVLLREDVAVAFLPYQNPKLRQARSIEELVGEPLGIAYWRTPGSGAKLTKADAARIMEIKLVREEPDWVLVATNLSNSADVVRFKVGEVGWCDGCLPIPRYLGIEDRLQAPPVLHLQVGPLELRGIEKKAIR